MKSISGRKAALALRSLCISELLMIGKGGWLNFHNFQHAQISSKTSYTLILEKKKVKYKNLLRITVTDGKK